MAGKNRISDDEDELDVEEEEQGDAVDSDEEEDEGPDAYEKDDFLVDDVEEEEEDAEEEERRRRKKKKKKDSEKNYELDIDDYELLEDNNITGFRRPKESQKFKRLRKGQTSAGNDRPGYSDDEFDGIGKRARRTDEETLKQSLFGDDEGVPLEDAEEEEEDPTGDEYYDEMDDFIEYDENDRKQHMSQGKLKKKPRQAYGISSNAIAEAHEIFGDVDEFLKRRKQGLAKMGKYSESSERRLEDEFEPLILSEKYMTEKDDEIRQIDIPERMQISEETTGPPPTDESSIEEESSWIYNQLISSSISILSSGGPETTQGNQKVSVNKDDVTRFLELMHIQKLDVPFIAMYRKEECPSLFLVPGDLEGDEQNQKKPTITWHKVLWAIQDLNRKWLLLQKRKIALQSYYNKRFDDESSRIYDENRLTLNKQLFKSIMDSLKAAESEREVDDVDSKFNLHFPPGETGVDEGQYKRPKRKSLYSVCSSSGLWEVASKFGYNSEQFGLQISLEKMRMDELEDARETPDEMASNFTCTMFETAQAVLKGARHMAAVEISCEPCVRKHVRCIFMDNAIVSTTPTPDGNTAIDSFHQFASVKWLKDKPLARFEDAQWLLIQKAEEEKLLQVTIKLPDNVLNKLIADSNEYYLSDGVSKSAQLWNEQRKMILNDAFSGFLLPSMEKEARSLLSSRAKSWLRMEYGKLLWDRISVAPFQRKENDLSLDDEAAPRVMACCWGAGKPSTTFVMLDSSGEVVDTLDAGFLSARSQNINDQQRKRNDQQRVLKFMMDHQPHVVVLGAVNLSCTRLKEDIYEVIFKIVEDNPRDVGRELDSLSIVYGDERLSRLYENSRASSDQLPGHSGIIKRAVALGRYMQNPLAMVATLCGPGREILSWNISSLDSFLTPDEKYVMIEQVMVDATNQVGLDVNLAIAHEWLLSPLQFISGLGPCKAAFLQRSLVRNGSVYSRKDLLTAHGIGKKVFVNAAGFLRVRRTGLAASSSQYIDLLDDTRIHPESYALAQELAKFVYLLDQGSTVDDDDDVLEMAIEHVREKPDSLKYFEVAKYAEEKGLENKNVTLGNVRLELIHGFQDWRRQYEEPNPDEEFYMITGETDDTLCEGRVVQVTVRRVQSQKAFCGFESGLTGILTSQDYSDDRNEVDLTEKLHEGDILTCKVKSIVKNRYQVYLTLKEHGMRNSRRQDHQNMDPYYHEDRSSLPGEREKVRKEKELAKKHFKPRMIVHPRFQNITVDEAIEFLSDKDPGESVVRPSSRGPSYLTLTIKVYDGVYAHKDIVEGGKEHKDITSLLRIGKTLKIGDDTFEDLDEVMDRYVDPLVAQLKAMLNYRKFKKGTKSEVDELLKVEKSEYPMRIVYCFGISIEHPGTFILTYIRSTNPHHEYISLYPKGFKFRKKVFEDIDRLVAYFQRHIDDPQQESGPSIQSVAAKVPMRSPATGGSSGNSFGGGWGGSGNNDGGGRGRGDGHPSGIPRPYGGGRGRGRGRGNDSNNDGQQDTTEFGAKKWGAKDDDSSPGWSNFPGAKVQNSPGREAFPGGWGTGSSDGGSSWGKSGGDTGGNNGSGGWGSSGGGGGAGGSGGWGSSGGGGGAGGSGGWGSSGGGGGAGSSGGWGSSGGGGGAGGSGGWGSSGGGGGAGGSGGWGSNGGNGGAGGGGDAGGNNGGSGWGSSGGGNGGGSGGWGSSGGGGGRGNGGSGGGSGGLGNSGGGGSGGWGSNGGGSNGGGWGQGSEGGISGGRGSGRGGNRDGGSWGQGSGGGRGSNRDDGGSGWGQGGRGRGGGGWSEGGRGGRGRDGGGGWSEGGRGGRGRDGGGGGWNEGSRGGRGRGGGGNRDGGNRGEEGIGGRGFGGGRRGGGRFGNRDGGSSGGGWSQGGGGGSWGSNGGGSNNAGGSNGGGNKDGGSSSGWGSWGQASGGASSGGGGGSGWGQASGGSAGGGSGWGGAKTTAGEQGGSGWGASKSPAPQGGGGSGWGATKSPAQQQDVSGGGSGWGATKQDGNSGGSGWGAAAKSPAPQDASTGGGGSGWGATKSPAVQDSSSGGGSGWGAAAKSPAPQGGNSGGGGSGWGAAAKSPAPQGGNSGGGGSGWGAAAKSPAPQGGNSGGGGSGWGAAAKSPAPQVGGNSGGGGSGWGATPAQQDGNSGGGGGSGWGAPAKSPAQQQGGSGGWGSSGGGW